MSGRPRARRLRNNAGENALIAPAFEVGMACAPPCAPASTFGGVPPGHLDGADPGLLAGLPLSSGLAVPGGLNSFIVARFMTSGYVDPVDEDGSWGGVKARSRRSAASQPFLAEAVSQPIVLPLPAFATGRAALRQVGKNHQNGDRGAIRSSDA